MALPPATARRGSWLERLGIGVVVATLWAPMIQMVFHPIPEGAATENKAPAAFPAFAPETWDTWPASVQAWFDASFGFRQPLVTAFNLISVLALHTSTSELVLLGRDGWLYYTVNGSIDDARGHVVLSAAEMEAVQSGLMAQQRGATERGAAYLFVVCPDKHSAHPEQLPPTIETAGGPPRLEQVLAAAPPSLHLLDLRGALLDARGRAPVYHRTDSHWNAYGALVGYVAILEAIQARLPEVRSFVAADFVIRSERRRGGGDLATNMLALPPILEEEDVVVGLPADIESVRGANAHLRVLVYHDSFWLGLQPYFEATFPNLTAIPSGYTFDYGEIDRQRPDIVLNITVERNLVEVARLPISPSSDAAPSPGAP